MIRGWCPTVHEPMPSGDGLLVRVKPFGGRLPAAKLAALAEAATQYSNGAIDLTSRGNLQIRGVHAPAAFASAMVAAGLADPDPQREARRNVITVPPCDDALVAEMEELLAQTPGLPAKFCVTVDEAGLVQSDDLLPLPLRGRGATRSVMGQEVTSAAQGRNGRGDACAHLLYPRFGQTTAASLAHLATLTPEIRTTPWRAFLAPGFAPVLVPGFATEPGTITTCPGAPACLSGTTPTRADAALLQQAGLADLHVSGCAKGCAHPRPATTLVGRNGRYDLVRHGRASDEPDLRDLTLSQAMAAL